MLPLKNVPRFFRKTLSQPRYAAGVLAKRLKAYAAYAWADGRSPLPEAVTLFLTHACNLRCKMCGQWGESGVTRKEASGNSQHQLTLAEAIGYIDQLKSFRPSVTLFGGEPFLFQGCADLIRYIKSLRMHCLVITNGSMLERFAGEIVEAGLDELNISLDAGQALHDRIRGMEGLFDRIISGIDAVNRCKAASHRSRPLINLQTTITGDNYRYLEQMLDVARLVQAHSLTFHNLIFLCAEDLRRQAEVDSRLQASSRGWEGFVFEPGIDSRELAAILKRIRSRTYPFAVDIYPNFSERQLQHYYRSSGYIPEKENSRCFSPWLVAYIFPDGSVRPCLNSDYSFGSLRDEPFGRIWNSGKALDFRRLLKARRLFPACIRCTELYRY